MFFHVLCYPVSSVFWSRVFCYYVFYMNRCVMSSNRPVPSVDKNTLRMLRPYLAKTEDETEILDKRCTKWILIFILWIITFCAMTSILLFSKEFVRLHLYPGFTLSCPGFFCLGLYSLNRYLLYSIT